MNPKNTVLLVLLAAALFAFIFYVEPRLRKPPPGVPRVLPGLKASEVTAISVQLRDKLEIRAELSNGVWRLTRPMSYPVLATNIMNLLHVLEDLSPQTRISAGELQSNKNISAEFGFDSPNCTIIIQQGENQRLLRLGHVTAPGTQIYAQEVTAGGVDVVDVDALARWIPKSADDWRDTAFVSLTNLVFDQITVSNGAKSFRLQRSSTNLLWKLAEPKARADNPKIEKLLEQLQDLRVVRFETDDTNAFLERFGLQPPELELTFSQGTNQVFSLEVGKYVGTNAATNTVINAATNTAAGTNTDFVFARRNNQSSIVVLPAAPLTNWHTDYSAFRDRHLIRISRSAAEVSEIQVQSPGGGKFIVQRDETNGNWIAASTSNSFIADTRLVQNFLANLDAIQVVPKPDGSVPVANVVADTELPQYGLATNFLRITVKSPDASADATRILDFGFSDGKIYARRPDLLPDESSVYLVRNEDVATFPTNALQLHQRRIWNFDVADVKSLSLHRGAKTVQFGRKSPFHWEPLKVPPGFILKDQQHLQLEEETSNLGTLEAQRWIGPNQTNLAAYDFGPNSLQLVIELKSGVATRILTLDLGGTSDGIVYAKTKLEDGQEWLFELSTRDAADIVSLEKFTD